MSVVDEKNQVRSAPGLEEMIVDPWSALSFKRAMGGKRQAGVSWTNPSWVGPENQRRLLAYKIRDAYYKNIARHFLASTDTKKRSDHREYGDAGLLVETVKAALLGDRQEIVVPGADKFNENDDNKQDITAGSENEEDQAEAKRAQSLEDDLRRWWRKERGQMKLVETERNAIKLGDAVLALGWDDKRKRPSLRVYDPGNYYPVLDDADEDEFTDRVDIAWELDEEETPEGKVKVHRITWEMAESESVGSLPWNDSDVPVTHECFMSEGVWTIDKNFDGTVHDFTEAGVEWVKQPDGTDRNRVPLGIDFIPVVHIPNTVALLDIFGASVLDNVMQILDDIASTDTDAQQASALAGFPVIAVSKGRVETVSGGDGTKVMTYGPGTLLEVGDGTMSVLDMSNGLTALTTYMNALIDRLEVNARVPAGVLGRVKPSDVPSGVALALSFGPLRTMVDEMRLVREDKYRLLLRFVTRLMLKNQTLTMNELPDEEAELVFGTFLIVDVYSVVTQVTSLLNAGAISRLTALQMLIEAGIPIEDAAKEIAAIQSEDFEGANALLDISNDLQLVFDYLGIEREPIELEPEVVEVNPETGLPIEPEPPQPDPALLP